MKPSFVCEPCQRSFKNAIALGAHRRRAKEHRDDAAVPSVKAPRLSRQRAVPPLNFCPFCGCNLAAAAIALHAAKGVA